MARDWTRDDGYAVSDDRSRIDVDVVYGFVSRSYWAKGIARDVVARSIEGSLNFGVFAPGGDQVGFCRVITDSATFGYLADVFVLEEHRGKQLGVFLMECVMAHPSLQELRVFRLATLDAHGLYEKFGFRPLAHPERMMEIVDPAVYAGNPQ
jgi:N-acetylglutamate synthase-like GNAT family acetyltransferase